jgi:hypothetical protein
MADWSLIRSTLEAWVTNVTGLTCYWRRRPRPSHFGDAYAILDIASRTTRGNDEVVTEYDASRPRGEEIVRTQCGQRQFTFSVQVRTSRTADDNDALHYTSMLRDRTCLVETTDDPWETAGVAHARVLSEVDIEYLHDAREMSIAQIDLLVNATATAEDVPTGWIETLEDFELTDREDPPNVVWTGDIDVG